MPSCCFGHCSLGCEASRAFVRWFQFPTRLMRMPDGVFANGQNSELRTGLGEPLPPNAHAKIARLLARLELVLAQIAELERERDAVVETETPDHASKMIQQLISLRGIGVQSATVLVREAFVRRFANGKALGSYAGLTSSPYSSGGIDREQGIGKGGNRRLRTVMVEL